MTEYFILAAAGFLAGLIDAAVGGGGLIQVPALLSVFPNVPIPVLFGTNKLASICGTASATWRYTRSIALPKHIVIPAALAALAGSWLGASTVAWLPPQAMRPIVLVLLVAVGLYTFLRPSFGAAHTSPAVGRHLFAAALLVGFGIGFYDGFFGPGTGSFLIFAFVRLFGQDMLHASASAKVINLATNLAALVFFITHDGILWKVGLMVAVANVIGAQVGSHIALKHGNRLVRVLLLVVVSVLVLKLGYDQFR